MHSPRVSRTTLLTALSASMFLVSTTGCELIASVDPDLLGQGGNNATTNTGGNASSGGGTTDTGGNTSTGGMQTGGGGATTNTGGMETGGGGAGSTSAGPECTIPDTCPQPTSECQVATCDPPGAGVCGIDDKTEGVGCTGGKCKAGGTCVECLGTGDCTGVETCEGNVCTSPACQNGMKDAGESDVDCGGICPTACVNGLDCADSDDCLTAFCAPNGKCADCSIGACEASDFCNTGNGHCEPKLADGSSCTLVGQCLVGHACVSIGASSVCCNNSCTGACTSCNGGVTGGTTGTCSNITTGTDPKGMCDDECTTECSAGACNPKASGTNCGTGPSCVNGNTQLNPQDTCDAGGNCVATGAQSCATFDCNPAMNACFTTCTAHADCAMNRYCVGAGGALGTVPGDCESTKPAPLPCAVDEECISMSCNDVSNVCD